MTTPNAKAWMAREYLAGRPQQDIAIEMGTSSANVSTHLKHFCWEWANKDVSGIYDDERKKYILIALRRWFMEIGHEPIHPLLDHTFGYDRDTLDFWNARREYAWLLRAEGMTYQQIGNRLGITPSRASQMVDKFARRMKRATRHASWSLTA